MHQQDEPSNFYSFSSPIPFSDNEKFSYVFNIQPLDTSINVHVSLALINTNTKESKLKTVTLIKLS